MKVAEHRRHQRIPGGWPLIARLAVLAIVYVPLWFCLVVWFKHPLTREFELLGKRFKFLEAVLLTVQRPRQRNPITKGPEE